MIECTYGCEVGGCREKRKGSHLYEGGRKDVRKGSLGKREKRGRVGEVEVGGCRANGKVVG